MNNLVSAKWLKDNIDNENIVIIDCRFNLMDKEYGKKAYILDENNEIYFAVNENEQNEGKEGYC